MYECGWIQTSDYSWCTWVWGSSLSQSLEGPFPGAEGMALGLQASRLASFAVFSFSFNRPASVSENLTGRLNFNTKSLEPLDELLHAVCWTRRFKLRFLVPLVLIEPRREDAASNGPLGGDIFFLFLT